jgi:hypothetical protein
VLGVAGSNPVAPTNLEKLPILGTITLMVVVPFLFLKLLKPILQIRDTIPAKQSHLQDICYYLLKKV